MNLVGIRKKQSGMALVLVMWLVAAMSLLVASVVLISRMDLKQQQLDQEGIRASALADKAMRLAMRQYLLDVEQGEASRRVAQLYHLQGEYAEPQVEIYPASGLIHLGSLNPELLLSVLQFGLGVDESRVAELRALLDGGFAGVNTDRTSLGVPDKFRVLEDLLLLPGVSINEYERMKDYFYVGQMGSPGVNPAAAPRELLSVLAEGDDAVVDEYIEIRDAAMESGEGGVLPHARFAAGLLSRSESSVYRVDVKLAKSKRNFKQRYWVSMARSREGLPWVIQVKEPIQVADVSIEDAAI